MKITAHKARMRRTAPLTEDEMQAQIAAALASRPVTVCPPAACAPIHGGEGFIRPPRLSQ